ncbi:MAG: cation:proton antiporter [Candidatus Woesebacteria bacterium]|jgi:Kef-type K+ transport system membrane component KefB
MDFSQLAVLLAAAGGFGIVAKLFKQPLLIGYLFAGLALALSGLVGESSALDELGKVGVTLLLFLLGLEMNLEDFLETGKVALLTGMGQIVFTSGVGFLIAKLMGFGLLPSVYIAVALTFSSTIIMVKLLSEKKDLNSLYGRIAVGFLLVQDLVAVLILMFLSTLGSEALGMGGYLLVFLKAALLISSVWYLSKKILPAMFERVVTSSNELLFIVSIAWALGVSAIVAEGLGFTLEVGGFLAGLALSNLGEHLQIAARTRPLRDFFLTIFFLLLGTKLAVGAQIFNILPQAIIFSVFVLVGNPIIVMIIMGALGYRKRTSFLAGLTVAQISEFSLILVAMGLSLGHLSETAVSLVVLVGIVTMTISTYLITGADRVYYTLKDYLSVFERTGLKEKALIKKHDIYDHTVLVGCDRTGRILLGGFKSGRDAYVVVDFNPAVFKNLTADNIPIIFGDINDLDVLEAANVDKANMVISTVSNLSDDLVLMENIKSLTRKPLTIFTASTRHDASRLYEAGADYVVVPEIVAGEHIDHLLKVYRKRRSRIKKMGKSHFKRLLYK